MSRNYVMLVGNPGAGKSTLLNSLTREAHFKAGISIGTGLTATLDTVEVAGITFLDTPGLTDPKKRQVAAEAISRALRLDGSYKLFFVSTLDAGRVRPADYHVISLVLNAIDLDEIPFYVIVNKVSKGELKKLADPEALKEVEAYFHVGQHKPLGCLLVSKMDVLDDADDAMMPAGDALNAFVKFVTDARAIYVPSVKVHDVDVKDWDAKIDALVDQLAKVQAELAEGQKRELAAAQQLRDADAMHAKDMKEMMDRVMRNHEAMTQLIRNPPPPVIAPPCCIM